MIEVNLYSLLENSVNASAGYCIDRIRFDKEARGISVMEFVKGFLKNNLSHFESALKNSDIVDFINGDLTMRTKDFASINYYLAQAGYLVQIQNVTDDEDNPVSVTAGITEWNIIDTTFLQYDYPTTMKVIPADGMDVVEVLDKIIGQLSFFDRDTLGSVRNPLKEDVENMKKVKNLNGSASISLTTKIYETLANLGIKIFTAQGPEG
jgi:predicted RNA binding protein with dsRBD fold (UPF0201 family)